MHKDPATMRKAAKLAVYERRQFSWAAAIVNGPKPKPEAVLAFRGAVEVFLLHARTLRDFFLRDRPLPKISESDILAADFFDNAAARKKPTFTYLVEPRTKERLDRALAHLTYDRIEYKRQGQGWKTSVIAVELDDAWNAFLRALPPERRLWFDQA